VGKSTLFNRLAQKRVSITDDIPGVTRDRVGADTEWGGRTFTLVDTGGIRAAGDDVIAIQVRRQAELGVEEADVVLFVVDGREGVHPEDEGVAELLRCCQKPVLLVVNKMDNSKAWSETYEFFRLGLGEPIPVSAEHGLNTGHLLDKLVEILPPEEVDAVADENVIKVAVVGRPNVGKSSLVNAVLGQERVITSDTPGTTRDAVDIPWEHGEQKFLFIDTAGLRRRARIKEPVEKYGVLRGLRAVQRADVVLLVLDAETGVVEQDKKIGGYVDEVGRGLVLVVNKWDLFQGKEKEGLSAEEVRYHLRFLDYAPIRFVSAKTGLGLSALIEEIVTVARVCRARVKTSELNEVISEATGINPPPSRRGKALKIYYASQVATSPPAIALFVNDPRLVHFSYRRYLENSLREAFGFTGTPLRLLFRRRRG